MNAILVLPRIKIGLEHYIRDGNCTKPLAFIHMMIKGKSFSITPKLRSSKVLTVPTRKDTEKVREYGFFTHLKHSNFLSLLRILGMHGNHMRNSCCHFILTTSKSFSKLF